MGQTSWTREIRGPLVWDDLSVPIEKRIVLISEREFLRLDDYTRSCPTGPSPGRVYRKALNWPALHPEHHPNRAAADPDPNWWVYRCERADDDPKAVDHHPFKPVFV